MDREWISRRIYSTDHHDRGCRWVVRLLLVLCLLPAVIEAYLYVSTGDTVTLPCDGGTDKDTSEVRVEWMFGDTTICSFKNGNWCEHRDFVNRIQLGSIRQNNFSLVINDVRLQDQGEYMCLINDAVIQFNRLSVGGAQMRWAAEIPPEDRLICKPYKDKNKVPDENPPGALSNVRPIVPLVIMVMLGIVVILGIVGLLVWFRRRRKNQARNQMQTDTTTIPEGVPLNRACERSGAER